MVKVFQIGFNRCGAKYIDTLFELNGYRSINWAGGQLAEDIFYSRICGEKPLSRWADDFTVFSNMESIHNVSMPRMEGFKHYEFLDSSYENSLFVLNTRNVDDWIYSRYNYRNGEYASLHAFHLNVGLNELNEIWRKEWECHVRRCREYFSGRDNLIEVDIDRFEQDDYVCSFSRWFDFQKIPPFPSSKVLLNRRNYRTYAKKLISSEVIVGLRKENARVAAKIISDHCCASKDAGQSKEILALSNLAVTGNTASGIFCDRLGNRLPIIRDEAGRFYFRRWHDKAMRPVGVLNDIAALQLSWARDMDLVIDMQDARLAGSASAQPVISYCRRTGAPNVFLWPLPEYHSIGSRNFLTYSAGDDVAFKDKEDRLVWRGNLSGHCSNVEAGIFENQTYLISKQIVEDRHSGKDVSHYADILRKNVRFRVVEDGLGEPDYDFRLTPSPKGREALTALAKEHLIGGHKGAEFFRRYKYILSMRGFDTGSNFISAANTNSVVLKEEDGWELFYTPLFKPWIHYIPLRAGCTDIREKLEWARGNALKCEEISRNARASCEILMDRGVRAQFLEDIVRSYGEFSRA